ncbi:MAG TPA: hypothetical protein VK681_39280 [Reyranella sp.]|nr:hypothetical protein [Reyranella sp.]
MAQKTGTLDISSLLAVNFQSAVKFGLSTIEEVLAADNANYNAMVQQMLTDLCAVSQDRQRISGSSIGGDSQEVDEFSRAPTQKDAPGVLIGFPLQKFHFAVGFTKQFEKKATPADYAIAQQAQQKADLRRIRYQLQKAIYTPTNYTFVDLNVDKASLAVKAFINADSSNIQDGPNGEAYDGTSHTHYDANATLTAAVLQASINDVVEHGFGGAVKVFINVADAAAVAALTGFSAYIDPRFSLNANANQPNQERANPARMDNRAIGIFGQAEVWTKPWAIANYAFVTDTADPRKPLVMRTDPDSAGLHLEATIESFPLRAEYYEHMFGIGVWNRLNGGVLQFNNASYSAPTFTL